MLESTVGGILTAGRIVETEAYLGTVDPASHAAARIGRTDRNDPMFGPPGTAYVYRIYGMHRCVNVVTDREGYPGAVLLRALEPLEGLERMAERRGRDGDLSNGPARLARALGIDLERNHHPFAEPPLRLLDPPRRVCRGRVAVSGRIGISRAADWPLRFFLEGHPDVSVRTPPPARRSDEFLKALHRPVEAARE